MLIDGFGQMTEAGVGMVSAGMSMDGTGSQSGSKGLSQKKYNKMRSGVSGHAGNF